MDAVSAPPGFTPETISFLDRLLLEVRQTLAKFAADPNASTGRNAKGDTQRAFDLAVDQLVRKRLAEHFPQAILTTEEQPEQRVGSDEPRLRIVVDPVDGSDNWRLGLPLSALCISAFPPVARIDVAEQQWAFIGDLRAQYPTAYAARGSGAFVNGERLQTTACTKLSEAYLTMQLSRQPLDAGLHRVLKDARSVRCYGAAAQDILWVARGMLDAHVDMRGRLTPESFLAATLAVEEAGGCIVGRDGRALPSFADLTDTCSIIVAANRTLAAEIVATLRD